LDYLLTLFKYRALVTVVSAGEELQSKMNEGKLSTEECWNAMAIQLCEAVKNHCAAFMLQQFIQAVGGVNDKPVRTVLERVCALYALSSIQDDQWSGLGIFTLQSEIKIIRNAIISLLNLLRPDAISLVDAFDIPDRVLSSTLGRSDGNVYEALFEAVKSSPLNQSDPFVGYEQVLRPHLDLAFLKLGNKKQTLSKL